MYVYVYIYIYIAWTIPPAEKAPGRHPENSIQVGAIKDGRIYL